jgi:predicted unusual protein kinase regulating ubiquinone biosynthesis (AarF/ABC1/UbiB family)
VARTPGSEKTNDAIPMGRLRRTAEIGGLVGGQAVRAYATKATNVARSADARHAADERHAIQAAEQIVDVLGHMKGAAMKVGQVASFIDPAGLPPEERDRFQAKLASLRDSAPRVEFKTCAR